MSIGRLEIVVCALAASGALGGYLVFTRLAFREGTAFVRSVCLLVFGLPVLCVVAATVTPPDVITMLMAAIPLYVLYGAGVGVWLLGRCRKWQRYPQGL